MMDTKNALPSHGKQGISIKQELNQATDLKRAIDDFSNFS